MIGESQSKSRLNHSRVRRDSISGLYRRETLLGDNVAWRGSWHLRKEDARREPIPKEILAWVTKT